jgi:hypothetical protein
MAAALDRIAPDWVLIDVRMRRYFDTASPDDRRPRDIFDWMASRNFVPVKTFTSDTYGTMEIYQRTAGSDAR